MAEVGTPTFISVEQMAEESGFSVRHIRRLVFETKPPVLKVIEFNKRRHMALREDFERWLKQQPKKSN